MAAHPTFEPAATIARELRCRRISARELTAGFLDRIAALNPTRHAYITVTAEDALRRADACDARLARGDTGSAFLGIPLAVKDVIDIAGVPTTGGSRVLHDYVAGRDAAVMDKLFGAGAVSLGKANLHEFAYGITGENAVFGTPVNAYDDARLACGSSSGSVAAVAQGMAVAGLGTDTGGSVRVPAVLNGLVGLKPTFGRISTEGVIPMSWSLDHVGLVTRTVGDCADLLALCGDASARGIPAASLTGLRIGLPRGPYAETADDEVAAITERGVGALEKAGATLIAVDLPDPAEARTVSLTIQLPEALSYHSRHLAERASLYGADVRAGLALGQFILAEHYIRARRLLTVYRQRMKEVFRAVDLLVTPATPIPAPLAGTIHVRLRGEDVPVGNALTRQTSFFNLTGHPALTLPCGMHSTGVPVGLQIIGRHWDEATVFMAATTVEAAVSGAVPRPRYQSGNSP